MASTTFTREAAKFKAGDLIRVPEGWRVVTEVGPGFFRDTCLITYSTGGVVDKAIQLKKTTQVQWRRQSNRSQAQVEADHHD